MSIVFAIISALSPLPALLLYLRKRTKFVEINRLAQLILIAFIIDFVCFALVYSPYKNTLPITNSWFIIQFLLLFRIYSSLEIKLPFYALYLSYLLALFFGINYFFIQGMNVFNSYSVTIASVFLIILALWYYYQLLVRLPEPYINRIPMVWINVGVLLYSSGNLLVFMLNNFFAESGIEIWTIHNILNIIKNLIFLVAIWQAQRKINYSSL